MDTAVIIPLLLTGLNRGDLILRPHQKGYLRDVAEMITPPTFCYAQINVVPFCLMRRLYG
jgi:hypothetical protein